MLMPSVELVGGEAVEEKEEFILLAANHPLLMAYEVYIEELERANRELFSELKSLKTTHEQLEKKAAEAYQRLLLKTEELVSLTDRLSGEDEEVDFLEGGVGGNKELNSIIEELKKEQDVLMDEVELTKSEAMKYKRELENQAKVNESNEEKLKEYQKKCYEFQSGLEITKHDKEVLESKLSAVQVELKNAREELEDYHTQKIKLEGDVKVLQRSLNQYKANYEELDIRKLTDVKQLEKELSDSTTTTRNLKSKLFIQETEIADLEEVNRKLQRELEQIKKDQEQLAKFVEESSLKGSLFDERERSLKRKEQDMKRKLAEFKTQEQEFLQREKQYKRQIQQLEEQWKQDMDEQQKKHALVVETAKSKQKALMDKYDKDYNDLYEKYGRVDGNLSKMQADCRGLEQENRQLSLALSEERGLNAEKRKDLEEEMRNIKKKESESRRALEVKLEEAQESITQLEGKLSALEKELKVIEQQLETAETKAKINEKKARELEETLAETAVRATNSARELEQLKASQDSKHQSFIKAYHSLVNSLTL
eukprot:TRINITY_DN17027_c0_g1_i3.p1 TRINITY_DN17027_c0_g1~~TRINITY_DN17027_c0_g1_i3.p1  ORF type:complete len:540 (-),score=174.41 TRINITY_DN17027_c0_g1_i3:395-2014(-)